MKNNTLAARLLTFIVALCISTFVFAAPLLTMTPLTATTIQLTPSQMATVQYTITNQSTRPHTLLMTPIAGITQTTTAGHCSNPFTLGSQQACILTLQVNGSALQGAVRGGPKLCQQGPDGGPSPFLCYQPSAASSLNITLTAANAQFTVTPSAGANGTISPNTAQVVNRGSNLLFTATPNAGYIVSQWFVDDALAQTGGVNFTLTNITANHTVSVSFTMTGTLYVGGENGRVYYSNDNGTHWTATVTQPGGQPVNSVFATASALYAGTQDGNFNSTTDNGATAWSPTVFPPSSDPVNAVFVTTTATPNPLYAGSANGHVYVSLNNGTTSWTNLNAPDGSAVESLFVVSSTVLYAGTANGNVFYTDNAGTTWTAINGSPDGSGITNIFVAGVGACSVLYVGTANEFVYTSMSLTGGGGWTLYGQTVYRLFVNADASVIDAGTQHGYVFSLATGDELGFVAATQINSLYLYTAHMGFRICSTPSRLNHSWVLKKPKTHVRKVY